MMFRGNSVMAENKLEHLCFIQICIPVLAANLITFAIRKLLKPNKSSARFFVKFLIEFLAKILRL